MRHDVHDFMREVHGRSQPGGDQFTAVFNRDKTVRILKNGVVLFPKVEYHSSGGTVSDANPGGDRVMVHSLETNAGATGACASSFLFGLGGSYIKVRKTRDW